MQEISAITSKTFSAVVRSTKGPLEKKSETMKKRVPTSGIVILSILYNAHLVQLSCEHFALLHSVQADDNGSGQCYTPNEDPVNR